MHILELNLAALFTLFTVLYSDTFHGVLFGDFNARIVTLCGLSWHTYQVKWSLRKQFKDGMQECFEHLQSMKEQACMNNKSNIQYGTQLLGNPVSSLRAVAALCPLPVDEERGVLRVNSCLLCQPVTRAQSESRKCRLVPSTVARTAVLTLRSAV